MWGTTWACSSDLKRDGVCIVHQRMLRNNIVVGKVYWFRETSSARTEESRYYGRFSMVGIIETAPVSLAMVQQGGPMSESRRRYNLRLARCESPDAVFRNAVALSGGDHAI